MKECRTTFLLVVFTLGDDCNQIGIEIFVEDAAIFKNNALRMNVLCNQYKPPSSSACHTMN